MFIGEAPVVIVFCAENDGHVMACGKHCISPNHTGESEYVNSKNALVTKLKGMEQANDGRWFGKGVTNTGRWGVLDEDSLICNMETAFEMFKCGDHINEEGIKTANEFSWKRTAKEIRKFIYV